MLFLLQQSSFVGSNQYAVLIKAEQLVLATGSRSLRLSRARTFSLTVAAFLSGGDSAAAALRRVLRRSPATRASPPGICLPSPSLLAVYIGAILVVACLRSAVPSGL